jgi:hypothetical protein
VIDVGDNSDIPEFLHENLKRACRSEPKKFARSRDSRGRSPSGCSEPRTWEGAEFRAQKGIARAPPKSVPHEGT